MFAPTIHSAPPPRSLLVGELPADTLSHRHHSFQGPLGGSFGHGAPNPWPAENLDASGREPRAEGRPTSLAKWHLSGDPTQNHR